MPLWCDLGFFPYSSGNNLLIKLLQTSTGLVFFYLIQIIFQSAGCLWTLEVRLQCAFLKVIRQKNCFLFLT